MMQRVLMWDSVRRDWLAGTCFLQRPAADRPSNMEMDVPLHVCDQTVHTYTPNEAASPCANVGNNEYALLWHCLLKHTVVIHVTYMNLDAMRAHIGSC